MTTAELAQKPIIPVKLNACCLRILAEYLEAKETVEKAQQTVDRLGKQFVGWDTASAFTCNLTDSDQGSPTTSLPDQAAANV